MSVSMHVPVLVAPLLRILDPRPGQVMLDGTVGCGGHALALGPGLAPGGRYIGLDVDEAMLETAKARLKAMTDPAVILTKSSFAEFPQVLANLDIAETLLPQDGRISFNSGGRVVDLRVSTFQTTLGEIFVLRILDRS